MELEEALQHAAEAIECEEVEQAQAVTPLRGEAFRGFSQAFRFYFECRKHAIEIPHMLLKFILLLLNLLLLLLLLLLFQYCYSLLL